MKKLAVFDLDGTLLNTLADLTDAYNHALDAHGFPGHSEEDYRRMVGNGVWNLLTASLPQGHRDEDTLQKVHQAFQRHYSLHANDKTRPYPGIPQLLRALREQGTKVAVLSNKPHEFTVSMMEVQLPGLADCSLGAREGVPLKPDPAAVLEILERFGLERPSCVYIGDSETDIRTGHNAGLDTIGVSWGFRTKETLFESGASVIVDKVEALSHLLVDKEQAHPIY